jgi:hypothetical protein
VKGDCRICSVQRAHQSEVVLNCSKERRAAERVKSWEVKKVNQLEVDSFVKTRRGTGVSAAVTAQIRIPTVG